MWKEFAQATVEGIKQGIRWSITTLLVTMVFAVFFGLIALFWWLDHVRFNF